MVRFGTDGWRDVIAENFTFENVRRASQAYASHIRAHHPEGAPVVVGYDTRFMARNFAQACAEVLSANGLTVHLSGQYLPTPALSYAVKRFGAVGGVMITASHNPPQYCGFKLKGSHGGSATPQMVQEVENHLGTVPAVFDAGRHPIHTFDIQRAYFDHLMQVLDLGLLKHRPLRFFHDSMGGAGCGWIRDFLQHAGLDHIDFQEVHPEPNPMFYGVCPEPIPQNLQPLCEVMQQEKGLTFAAVTDGDADRIGAVVAGGHFFNSHQIFAVLLKHLHDRGSRGRVIKTVSVSALLDVLCEKLDLEVTTTPIGFKYITEEMLKGDVLIGGEESGGLGMPDHLPERDGILNALLLLEAVAHSGKSLPALFAELEAFTGIHHAYDRLDLHLPTQEAALEAVARLLQNPSFLGRSVLHVESRDGTKWHLEGHAWLMVRSSGTEPVLRVYCEAPTSTEVQDLLQSARALMQS
ncbi:phosphoglucomutase/phosphomannomutase family protein [Deinococcus misasensis]|uniref:phosphoglucomutase/phosphomannomutase family protein n=1 Tax=Deinococcus misasensis TaxID=392413 RepID=UPI00068D46C4|nr:phosphoglucomutase/phosphomannomutase family protein [Deinococcus misasensis]